MRISLKEFIDRLTDVEFSQHQLSRVYDNDEDNKLMNTFISLVNQGLVELHRRFLLKRGVIHYQIKDDQYRYKITDDSPNLLSADVPLNLIEVIQIFDECGLNVPFNNTNRYENDCKYNNNLNIQFTDKDTFTADACHACLKIIYRKGPDKIPRVEEGKLFDPSRYDLDIDYSFLDALTFYCAQRMFAVAAPLEGYAAMYSPAILYRKKYEEECIRLEASKLDLEGTGDSGQRFYDSRLP